MSFLYFTKSSFKISNWLGLAIYVISLSQISRILEGALGICEICLLCSNDFTGKDSHQQLLVALIEPFIKWKDAIEQTFKKWIL